VWQRVKEEFYLPGEREHNSNNEGLHNYMIRNWKAAS
jgi:hypothetical protein